MAIDGGTVRGTSGHAVPGNRWDLLHGVHPKTPKVSVIVAHYEQRAQLSRTLHALRRQDHPSTRLQIIVADDGSAPSPTIPSDVTMVRQEHRGFRLAAVRNLGASHAEGDVLVFLDADTTPEPQFIRELTRLPALAPDCVTVGRRRHADLSGTDPNDDIRLAVRGRVLPAPEWLSTAYRDTDDLLTADERSYRYLIGAVLACSRSFFESTGGFDESFTSYGGEDWEWGYRAWIAGAVFAHVPNAVAWHDGPDVVGREDSTRSAKNAEAMRLADLIPVPGSRGHGRRAAKVDIAVTGPGAGSTPAQSFVSQDSVLAGLPGAEVFGGDRHDRRFDRVRLTIELLRPVRVDGPAVVHAVERVTREQLGELILTDEQGVDAIRIVSSRAASRARRWGRTDLFVTIREAADGIELLTSEPDVEAYVGGWDHQLPALQEPGRDADADALYRSGRAARR